MNHEATKNTKVSRWAKMTAAQRAAHAERAMQYARAHPELVRAIRKRHYAANRSKILAETAACRRERYRKCAEAKRKDMEKTKARVAEYRRLHPERVAASSRRTYLRHKGRILQQQREYRVAHPDKSRARSKRAKFGQRVGVPASAVPQRLADLNSRLSKLIHTYGNTKPHV